MKKVACLLGVAIVMVSLPALLVAGDFHTGTTLLCSQCHVMHYSQQHGYNSDGTGQFWLDTGGPFTFLLRADVNDLCLSCHDGVGAFVADVLGASAGTDIRQGGFLNRLNIEGLAATGHTLDILHTAPGSNPAWKPEDENGAGHGLNCTNCHQQHGYAGGESSYRNLKMDPGNHGYLGAVVTYNDGPAGQAMPWDATKDVFQRAPRAYDEADVDFNEPDITSSGYGNWCGGCHTDFHGSPGDQTTVGGAPDGTSFSHFKRHPDGGVNIGAIGGGHSNLDDYNAHTNKVKVMSEVGVWRPTAGDDVTPSCFSCHKGHGNGNAFGLIYRSGTGALTENGDSNGDQLEHLCGQCHVQASAFANP